MTWLCITWAVLAAFFAVLALVNARHAHEWAQISHDTMDLLRKLQREQKPPYLGPG